MITLQPNIQLILPSKLYLNMDVDASLKEYHEILDTLIYLHEKIVEAKKPMKEYELQSDTLVTKFYYHSFSFHHLMSGYGITLKYYKEKINNFKILDLCSALVILRAQFETFLMYNHIYINPNDDSEKELRWYAWIYSSLLNRQKFPAENDYALQQKAHDQMVIAKMKTDMQLLPAFSNLTSKQQKTLVESGSGKLFYHWSKIMEDCGYGKEHFFTHFYNFLCTHAHSEGTSLLQIKDSGYSYNANNPSAKVYLWVSKYILCSLIMRIRKRYQIVDIMYNPLPQQMREAIEFYSKAGEHVIH